MCTKTLLVHQLEGAASRSCLTENKNWEIADVIRVVLLLRHTQGEGGQSLSH